eukprot:jgi/Tetstr1/456341/TSEL_043077.t1
MHVATGHLDSAILGDQMKDYERRVFEATVASGAKATVTSRVAAALAGRERGRGRAAGAGLAREVITSDGVGHLSSELLALCEVTFRSLTAQTRKSYAGELSQLAEFCHNSESISPLEVTTATVVRYAA